MKNDYKKISKTRRQRGYQWEDTIVKRFNSLVDWNSVRLGSPSNTLPDVMAVNNNRSIIIAIEAKSGTSNDLRVPFDQIERCIDWVNRFDIYNTKKVILALKFSRKKRIGQGLYGNRQLREFFKVWSIGDEITDCVCNYDGEFFRYRDNKRHELVLDETKVISKN